MSAHLALFPKGFKGEKYRATDGAVFVCAEGRGTTTVDGKVLEWGPNDVFVVPPWKAYADTAGKELRRSRSPTVLPRRRSGSGERTPACIRAWTS